MEYSANFKDLIACVVMYEQAIEKCITLNSLNKSLKNQFYLDVILYDNSTVKRENIINFKTLFNNLNIHYITDPSNPGVSKAYNEAAKMAETAGKKWLILFDQDTDIHESFIMHVLFNIQRHPCIQLFCPIIKSNNIIISPVFVSSIWQKPQISITPGTGIQLTKNFTLINSGVVISCDEFKLLGGYDEDLKLDFSDHYFFYKYKKRNKFFYVLPVINNHNLSSFFENDKQKVLKRFSIYYQASLNYSFKIKNMFPVFWAFLRGVKLAWQYKSFSFLKYSIIPKK